MTVEAKLSDLALKVYDLIRLAGWEGKTTDEVEAETGLPHQTASARVNELMNKGLIERRGIQRPTRSGRKAFVYVQKGLTAANAREEAAMPPPATSNRP